MGEQLSPMTTGNRQAVGILQHVHTVLQHADFKQVSLHAS